jgi:hypothetical protein
VVKARVFSLKKIVGFVFLPVLVGVSDWWGWRESKRLQLKLAS